MASTGIVLLALLALFVFPLFWMMDRRIARSDAPDAPLSDDEADIVVSDTAVAERLRREASATDDPAEKASLTELADEAEADVDKLKKDLREQEAETKPSRS